ncbi:MULTISPECIES: hypothetical protein [Methylosinus]|nr:MULTISPECIES: hypothetical protein [Methylosinus]
MPEAPYWIAAAGLDWRIGGITLTPIIHIVAAAATAPRGCST